MLAALERDGADLSRPRARYKLDARETRAAPDLAAELRDASADFVHHVREDVAAHVRLGIPANLGLRTCGDERLEHKAVQGALGARVELAVRERAGPAAAELDVALRVELARLVEVLNGLRAPRRVVAALNEQRLEPGSGQGQGAEEARAPSTNHDGAASGGGAHARGERGRSRDDLANTAVVVPPGELREQGPLGARSTTERSADGVGEVHGALLARVDGTAPELDARDVVGRRVQSAQHGGPDGVALCLGGSVETVEGNLQA